MTGPVLWIAGGIGAVAALVLGLLDYRHARWWDITLERRGTGVPSEMPAPAASHRAAARVGYH